MNFLKRLFGKKDTPTQKTNESSERSKFMPEEKLPVDEMFMENFTENGGKFIYCESIQEVTDNFSKILEENEWSNQEVVSNNSNFQNIFKLKPSELHQNYQAIVIGCEYLIGSTGAILLSSNQIGEKKLAELPETLIVYAKTSQLIELIGEGLQNIKRKYERIPSNITTIKKFDTQKEDDFLTYGSTPKNLYLLLQEDL